jgi:hypothetical protein
VARAKPVMLSNKTWPTQKLALAHFGEVLAKYRTGEVVDAPADHDDLDALVTTYDRSLAANGESKRGAGVKHLSRERNFESGWSTDGFHVHRMDGTSIDVSYIKAIQSLTK